MKTFALEHIALALPQTTVVLKGDRSVNTKPEKYSPILKTA